jgi:iron(III) transport system substrate-binding protein
LAVPIAGFPAIHAGIIGQAKGEKQASDWYDEVSTNAVVMKRDAEVATAVAKGELDWGLTSSSDAVVEKDHANNIAIVFPDQAPDQIGTVRIPSVAGVMRSSPHPRAARKLAIYLTLPITEDRLAMSDAAQIPLSPQATFKPRVMSGNVVRWAEVDFAKAADVHEALRPKLRTLFEPKAVAASRDDEKPSGQ